MKSPEFSFRPNEVFDAPREAPERSDQEGDDVRAQLEAEEAEARAKEAEAKREAKMLEQAEQKLDMAKRDCEEKLRQKTRRCDEVVEAIKDRLGDDRPESIEQINEQIAALTRLKEDSEREVLEAAGVVLWHEITEWMWEGASDVDNKLDQLKHLKADLKSEERLEQAHGERAGLDEGVKGQDRSIATKTIRIAAEVIANHIAPGYGGLIVNIAELALHFIGVLGDPESVEGIEIGIPLTLPGSLLNINFEVKIDDSISQPRGLPLTLSIQPDIGYNIPSITFIEENPEHPERQPPEQDEQPDPPRTAQTPPVARTTEEAELASESEPLDSEQPDARPPTQASTCPGPEDETNTTEARKDPDGPEETVADRARPIVHRPIPDKKLSRRLIPDPGEAKQLGDLDASTAASNR